MISKKYSSISILIIAVFMLSACKALGLGVDYDATSNAHNELEEELEDFEDELKDWEDELQETQAALSGDTKPIPVAEVPAEVQVEEPVEAPTEEPVPTEIPFSTATPPPAEIFNSETGEVVFEDDFTDFMDTWDYFGVEDASIYIISTTDGLTLNIPETYDYFYAYRQIAYDSPDVRVDYTVEFMEGTNDVSFYLFCRDNSIGEYGVTIYDNGDWRADFWDSEAFELTDLGSGESTDINTGGGINTITAICKGNQISFLINGVEIFSITDDKNPLAGGIGFSLSSGSIANITAKIHGVTVTVP